MKELPYEEFVTAVQELPTPWLTQLYKELHHENERLHAIIDDYHDQDEHDNPELGKVIDTQIEVFNKLLVAGNMLTYRDKPLPIFEDTK